jgi:hypothetical protein
MKSPKIKFVVHAVTWFDNVNGNTYHSAQILRVRDGKRLYCEFQYGYDDQYKTTALTAMVKAKWLRPKYREKLPHGGYNAINYERENNYPIDWNVHHGLKRECIANGKKGG